MLHEDFAVIPQLKHQCGSLERKKKKKKRLPDPKLDCYGGTSHKPQRVLIQNLSPRFTGAPDSFLQAPTEPPGPQRAKGEAGGWSPASRGWGSNGSGSRHHETTEFHQRPKSSPVRTSWGTFVWEMFFTSSSCREQTRLWCWIQRVRKRRSSKNTSRAKEAREEPRPPNRRPKPFR